MVNYYFGYIFIHLIIISVAKEVQSQGLNHLEKSDIVQAVRSVMTFFSKATSIGGKKAKLGKSDNVMDKARARKVFGSGGGVFTQFWKSVDDFDGSRENSSCLVVSCDYILRQCVKSLDKPYLIVSSIDLNEKDFSKELAKVLIEEQTRICVEIEGLSRQGSARLVSIIKLATDNFDDRVIIVLFGEQGNNMDIDYYSEKHFRHAVGSKCTDTAVLTGESSQFKLENECLKKELNSSRVNTSKLVREISDTKDKLAKSESKIDTVTKESDQIKNKLCNLESDLEIMKEKYTQKNKDVKASDDIISELTETMEDQAAKDQELLTQMRSENMKKIEDLRRQQELELQKLRVTVNEFDKSKITIEQSYTKVQTMEKERDEIKSKFLALHSDLSTEQKKCEQKCRDITELTKRNEDMMKKSEESEDLLAQLRSENLKEVEILKTKISMMEQSCSESDATNCQSSVVKQTQTEHVLISPSPLSMIKECIDKNRGGSRDSVDLAYRSVRDLKCNISFVPSSLGVLCEVKIVKGKNIMKYHGLLEFTGFGESEQESKVAAFSTFLSSVSTFIE